MSVPLTPTTSIKDGEALADSRDVAGYFQKRHDDVLKAIRNLIAKKPSLGLRHFAEFKIKGLTGESTSHYNMDPLGFTLLVMGFTGDEVLDWKIGYVQSARFW